MDRESDITVVVPFYNAERTIRDCIDSIKRQEGTTFSVLLVDDGSDDCGAALVSRSIEGDARFKLLVQTNAGVAAARNLALAQGLGMFVMFLDADDRLPDGALSSLLSATAPNVDLVYGDYERFLRVDARSLGLGRVCWGDSTYTLGGDEPLDAIDAGLSTPWAKLYRADVISANDIRFEEGVPIGEDTRFNLAFCACAKGRMTHVGETVYEYALGGGASSGRFYPSIMEYMTGLYRAYDSRRGLFTSGYVDGLWFRFLDDSLMHLYLRCPNDEARDRALKGIDSFLNACPSGVPRTPGFKAAGTCDLLRAGVDAGEFLREWEAGNRKRIRVGKARLALKRLLS